MVKCIQNCFKFLKIFQKSASDSRDSKVIQNGQQLNPDALNVTSLHDKEVNLEEKHSKPIQIKHPYRPDPMSSPSKLINSYQNSPEKASVLVSECNLSPISKRSHSEDFSPVKIPSPTGVQRLIPNVFIAPNSESKPKVYAATPKSRLPRSLKRIMCPLEVS